MACVGRVGGHVSWVGAGTRIWASRSTAQRCVGDSQGGSGRVAGFGCGDSVLECMSRVVWSNGQGVPVTGYVSICVCA